MRRQFVVWFSLLSLLYWGTPEAQTRYVVGKSWVQAQSYDSLRTVFVSVDTVFLNRTNKDVYLIRKAANQLQTPDTLFVGGVTANGMLYNTASGQVRSTGAPTNGQVLIGSTGAAPVLATLTGTANQVTVTNGAGTITLATPQDLHTGATPTFGKMILSSAPTNNSQLRIYKATGNGGLFFVSNSDGSGAVAAGVEYGTSGSWVNRGTSGGAIIDVTANAFTVHTVAGGTDGATATLIQRFDISTAGNIGFNTTTYGTGLAKGIAVANGTGPSTSITDGFQVWSADYAAGDARMYLRTETGNNLIFGNADIRSSTGTLTLATDAGNGNVILDPHGTGIILLESEIRVNGDTGGAAGYISYTDAENTGTARSTGVGTIKFADATNRDNTGFIKAYIGTTAVYIPVFAAN